MENLNINVSYYFSRLSTDLLDKDKNVSVYVCVLSQTSYYIRLC